VEYSLDSASGSSVSLPGIFTRTNTLKVQHLFSTPIYTRYIRIIVNTWNAHISMRAALIVKSCSSCFATSTSVQGSVAEAACACPAGRYRYSSTIDVRALALVPGRAQLSTLANRGLRNYAATAQFSSTAGPAGSKGAVTFDRATSQYLDGGSQQFDIRTNGFTAVVVVMFTMTPLSEERILDFGNGVGNNNILLWRNGATSQLIFGIWNGNSACSVTLPNVLQQNNWLTIVAMYDSISTSLSLTVGVSTNSVQCTARTNRNVASTFIGRTFWSNNYMSGRIAGLYAVDALLTEPGIQAVVSRINAGEDTLQTCVACLPGTYLWNEACEACPAGLTSLAGATSIENCQCAPGFSGASGGNCTLCAAGTYKLALGMGPCLTTQQMQNNFRADTQQAVEKAAYAKEQLESDKARCTNSTKRMLCPTSVAVPFAMRAVCVGAMTDCFVFGGVFDNTALAAYKTSKENACPIEGERYCDQEGICVGKGASCAPATQCPPQLSFRCPSWTCAVDSAGCTSASGPAAYPAGQQRCPDALCYPGTGGIKECAKAGANWRGCPPGLMQCTNGKYGTCARHPAACEEVVGCPANLVSCGFLRHASGRPRISRITRRPIANCVQEAACQIGRNSQPKDITRELHPSAAGTVYAMSDNGKKAMELRMGAGGFTVGGNAQAVNFSVTSVPDSLVQEGAFGRLFGAGAPMASLIQIAPSAEVQILGGMILDIPLLDEEANLDPALCALALKNTRMLYISDITNVSGVLSFMGACGKGVIGGCSCAVSVTHFSTYGLVDSTVMYNCTSNSSVAANGSVCECDAGFSGPDGGPCVPCAPGEFKDTRGSAACSVCGVGKFMLAHGAQECVSCPSNSQSTAPGVPRDRCLCDAGYAGDAGICTACVVGTFKHWVGHVSAHPADNGATGCLPCADDQQTATAASEDVIACEASRARSRWRRAAWARAPRACLVHTARALATTSSACRVPRAAPPSRRRRV